MYTNIFSFGEQILPEYQTSAVGLSKSMARSMKLMLCVQQGFPNKSLSQYSYKWLCFSNSYWCIG